MQAEFISSFSEYSKTAMISAKELLAINSKMMGKMLDSQISLAALYVESSEKQMGLIESLENPSDFISKETSLIEEYSARFADVAQERMQIAQETSDELKSWVEKGLKVADEAVKEAQSNIVEATPVKAPTAKKPAVKTAAKAAAPAKKAAPVKKAASATKKPTTKKAAPRKAPAKKMAK